MKTLLLLSLPLLTFLASCSSTPTSRIQKNPVIYKSLKPEHQKLVAEGQIARGMTKPAVFLALGSPSNRIQGNKEGKSFERWVYQVYRPTYTGGISPYYRYGFGSFGRYGRHGRFGGSRFGLGVNSSFRYVPRHGSSVNFSKGKVTGWSSSSY